MSAKGAKDDEDIPLRSTSPETNIQEGFWSRNVVCSKLKILLLVLLFVVLLVVVIVLAILLANARRGLSGRFALLTKHWFTLLYTK